MFSAVLVPYVLLPNSSGSMECLNGLSYLETRLSKLLLHRKHLLFFIKDFFIPDLYFIMGRSCTIFSFDL